MASAATNQMNIWEQKYYDITELYSLADELLATVQSAENPEMQLAMVESLVETVGESADVLTEEYIALCEGKAERKKAAKTKVEGALRKVYIAMADFSLRVTERRNAAHLVLKKIKRQLEQVIANFVEMVALSLDRIMQKHDVEELKARHNSIALMLYSQSHGQTT
ncbi:MAG: hypothetical protein SFW64_08170 [Alphaproteobacteria bacterium]|nr:hypothetical protein [Alphaproteobacteria bacterium]